MQTSNNYEREWTKDFEKGSGVFNGDIGTITNIDMLTNELTVTFEDGRETKYLKGDLNEITLSYAITIHKSQGSEFDVVVIPVVGGPPMLLTRNLLYTGITRAKKLLIVIGNDRIVDYMIKNVDSKKRNTGLEFKLKK